MLFVIISHCHVPVFEPLKPFYQPFFLTLFFLMSGFLLKIDNSADNKYLALIKKIFKSLMVPYFWFSLFRSLISITFVKSIVNGSWLFYIKDHLCDFILGDLFWFIPCLIVVQLLYGLLNFLLFERYYWAKYVCIFLSFASVMLINHSTSFRLPWNIDTAFYAIGFFTIGTMVKDNAIVDRIQSNEKIKMFSLVVLVGYIFLAFFASLNRIDMHQNLYGNQPVITLFVSLFGCLAVLLFSVFFWFGKYFCSLGRYSLVVFCTHGIGYSIVERLLPIITFGLIKILPSVYCALYVLLTGAICICLAIIIERYFPFIIGKRKKYVE